MGKQSAQSSKNRIAKGGEGFNDFYSHVYKERWPHLRAALLEPSRYLPLAPKNGTDAKDYFLDAASVLAAFVLPIEGCKNILDLCAAPGGKSLVLAQRMEDFAKNTAAQNKEFGVLPDVFVCNELSGTRRARLASVLDTYTDSLIRSRIKTTGYDGARWCLFEQEIFDAVLLDAPCSSERHVLQNQKYLNQWSASRIKHLAQRQWALLSSAFRLLKNGGYLLYVTCALAPQENDGTIEKLLKKFGNAVLAPIHMPVSPYSLPGYEHTEYGYCILPDVQGGAGPLYFALIQKTPKVKAR
ncbi:RsmB/NOP family class I SAM-dependent RNA methyltransferase [Treponema sp. OMZ 840]|uniref:RsmB/NOP family class I SAM-dependent RNA methyltransferase n=1 Tax=Treponema sp. OMZ 840 TaxID=244313 RepID=UPI003D900315